MEKLLELYRNLLKVYSEQVIGLEHETAEVQKQHHVGGIPYRVLNSRMFIPDAYLTNVYNGGICYEEKSLIMPYLVDFIAHYEKITDEDKAIFEAAKDKSDYQVYLDSLLVKVTPFKPFLEAQLSEYRSKEIELKSPYRPQRQNATNQWAKYRKEEQDYQDKLCDIKRCINEIETRILLFEESSKR